MTRYGLMKIAALLTTALVAAVATAAAGSPAAAGGGAPKILQLEFYEDLEDGFRYNVAATIKDQAERVTARSGSVRTNGHASGSIGTTGPGKLWFFREGRFVKRVKEDLYADGIATVIVKASGDGGSIRKSCELNLEPDPQFGDYATGDCERL